MAGTSASGEQCLDELVAYIERRGPELMSGELVLRPAQCAHRLLLQNRLRAFAALLKAVLCAAKVEQSCGSRRAPWSTWPPACSAWRSWRA